MKSLWLSLGILSFPSLAACTPAAEPTAAQMTIVRPGIEAEQRGNYEFALFTYRYWARLNVALAQYRLARLYEHGLGTDQDNTEAAKWYRAASETGYRPAHAALARLYQQGRGVPQDNAAAFALYQKAAAAGDAEVQHQIDRFLDLGRGTAVNPSSAMAHRRVAADAGNVDAQLALAELFPPRRRAPEHKDLHSAGNRVAPNSSDPRRRQALAHMPAKTTLEARREIELPGVHNDTRGGLRRSSFAVEMVAEPGGSVLEHEALARDSVLVAQYRQAARQGDGLASFKLAEAFERGRGVAPDLVEALTWYGIAQRQGYARAASHAEKLRGELPSAEVQEATGRTDQWWQKFRPAAGAPLATRFKSAMGGSPSRARESPTAPLESSTVPVQSNAVQKPGRPSPQVGADPATPGPAARHRVATAASTSESLSALPAGDIRIFIHHVADRQSEKALAKRLADYLRRQGFTVAAIRPVDLNIREPSVRYFFARDRAASQRLVEELVRFSEEGTSVAPDHASDFTHFLPKPRPGNVEVWLPSQAVGTS